MKGSEIYVELLNARNQAGELMFQRIKLAAQLLRDRQWCQSPEGGDGHAIDRIEDTCFGDICGAMSLARMLEIYTAFPKESLWREYKYNLRVMYYQLLVVKRVIRQDESPKAAPMTREERRIQRLESKIEILEAEVETVHIENKKLRKIITKYMGVPIKELLEEAA